MYRPPDHIQEPLYVICPIFNPIRFKSRWKHYHRFAKYMKDSGAILFTVEAAFGERAHAIGDHGAASIELTRGPEDSYHITVNLRTPYELWLKENLVNIGLTRLPANWKYVAWIDGDVAFARPNWVGDTIHQLQHYRLVQMFSTAQDLGPQYQPLLTHRSFVDCYLKGEPILPRGYYGQGKKGPIMWHPGFAWAARREAVDDLGGLIDWAVLGAGDNHMAHALIGRVMESCHPHMGKGYRDKLLGWQFRADKYIRKNIGCVSGLLVHYWHGKKKDRRYWDRWQILVKHQFDPNLDLKYDSQGCLQLEDRGDERSISLRDDIMAYFRQRNEDSIDV